MAHQQENSNWMKALKRSAPNWMKALERSAPTWIVQINPMLYIHVPGSGAAVHV